MRKTLDIRTVYRYAVCFAALITLTIGVVRAGGAIIDVIYAEPGYHYITGYRDYPMYQEMDHGQPPAEVVTAQEEFDQEQRTRNRYWALPRLLSGLGLTLLAAVIYMIYKRALVREQGSTSNGRWEAGPIYYYLVCLVSVIVLFAALNSTLAHTAEVIWPYQTYSSGPVEVWYRQAAAHEAGQGPAPGLTLVMDEVEESRQRSANMFVSRRLKSGLQSSVLLLVTVIIHITHWQRVSRGFEAADADVTST